jgi:hypothetical protein
MAIKANADIEAMADQLAALRGQSVAEVVAAALRAELAREPKGRHLSRPARLASSQRAKVTRILEMVRAAGPASVEGGDRTAFLYDDEGLPR